MGLLNRILNAGFGLVFAPFAGLDPIWALSAISLLAGVLMLWIFGKVSDQAAIGLVRDRIRGNLIGIRLFGDDLGLLFRLQGRILRQTLTYLRYALVPMLVLLVPFLLILAQLNLRFSARPLEPGERTLIKVKLRGVSPMSDTVRLEVPSGVSVETPGVRIEERGEVAWRIRVDQPGHHRLTVKAGGDEVEKELIAGGGWGAISPLRASALADLLLYPGERPIRGSSKIERVEVNYAPLPLTLFGWAVHWLLFFFVASIVFGFAFRRVLGVEI